MNRLRIEKGITVYLSAIALMVGALTGCGSSGVGNSENTGAVSSKDSTAGDEADAQGGQQGTAMGRYVERQVALNDNSLRDWDGRIFELDDGSLLLAVNGGYMLRSWDNGGSWIDESLPWLTQIVLDDNYIASMAVGPDQTMAVLYSASLEQIEQSEPMDEEADNIDSKVEEDSEGDSSSASLDTKLLVIRPDNTQISVEMDLQEDEGWADAVYISDTGRIIVSTLGDTLYEVGEDGSFRKFLTVEEGRPDLLRFHGNFILMDGLGYEAPLIYDMETEEYLEDEVLSDFVRENYSDRESYTGRNYDLFLFSGGDDAIYVAGQSGVYRHVLGGAAMERVVEGRLSILGNPAYRIMDMMAVGNNEFLVLFTGGKLVRFVYDPDIPTVPDDELIVYSLEEKATIRQAVSLYQAANPSVYVNYEVGLEQASVTGEDAVKNLNARIMAGKGPDVLILDNMPVDSYIEKGLLMDIGPVLDSMGEGIVFPNVRAAFEEAGHVYRMPAEIQIPYIVGFDRHLNKMTDMSGVAETIEDLREENPGDDLLRVSSAKAVMRLFSMSSAPAWKTADGTINSGAISEYLTQAKRIYDAQMDGLSEEALEDWDIWSRIYLSDFGEELEDSDEIRMNGGEIYFKGNLCKLVVGSMKDIDEYTYQTSLAVSEGMEDCRSIPMPGQGGDVFWARTMVGINATSENTELAEDFLKVVFGSEVQGNVLEGISVNKKAILDDYEDQRRIYKDNDYISGSSSLSNDEGIMCEMRIRVPDEKQVDELLSWIESRNVAYVEDTVFEDVIYEEGSAYMKGNQSLEEAVDAIDRRLGIYLAE